VEDDAEAGGGSKEANGAGSGSEGGGREGGAMDEGDG
jgi:hypothetical protein